MHSAIKFSALVLALVSFASPAFARDRGHDRGHENHGRQQSWSHDNNGHGNDDRRNDNHARYDAQRYDRGDWNRRGDDHDHDHDRDHDRGSYRYSQPRYVTRVYVERGNPYAWRPGYYRGPPRWARGGRFYGSGYAPTYIVSGYEYGSYGLRQPPRGYYWRRDDLGNFLLVAAATGIIADLLLHGGY